MTRFEIPQMKAARIGDINLGYHVAGTGDPVLLIMGYTMAGRVWVHQWPTLAEHHAVAFYDNRGVGATDAPGGAYSMHQLASDAVGLLDHLGWQTAHVVGVSMGGMIAQHVALSVPDRVRTLTLIATTAGGRTAALPTARGLRHFLRAQVGNTEKRLDSLTRLLFPPEFIASADVSWLRDVMRHDFTHAPVPFSSRRSQLAAILRHDVRRTLPRMARIPTLIVRPGKDALIAPKESDRLKALIPHAQVLRLDDAGHGAIRQCKDRVNEALLQHFATV